MSRAVTTSATLTAAPGGLTGDAFGNLYVATRGGAGTITRGAADGTASTFATNVGPDGGTFAPYVAGLSGFAGDIAFTPVPEPAAVLAAGRRRSRAAGSSPAAGSPPPPPAA